MPYFRYAFGGECLEAACSTLAQWLCSLPQATTLLTTPNLLKHSPPAAASLTTRPAPRPALRNVCTAALSSSSPDEPAEHAVRAGQQEGSAEQFLLNECGIEKSKVDGIITAAVAWRVTPGGRQLIDRRRRSRIERNMLQCAEYLIKECGIETGQSQIHAWLSQLQRCMQRGMCRVHHACLCHLQRLGATQSTSFKTLSKS